MIFKSNQTEKMVIIIMIAVLVLFKSAVILSVRMKVVIVAPQKYVYCCVQLNLHSVLKQAAIIIMSTKQILCEKKMYLSNVVS